jgi:hypothetical protein
MSDGPCGPLSPSGTGKPPVTSSGLCEDPSIGPTIVDLYFYQGDDERRTVRWEDPSGSPAADLTNAAIEMQIRKAPADREPDILCEVSVGDGVTITNGALAEFEFVFVSAKTALLAGSDPFFYDLQVTPAAGDKTTILAGKVYFDLDVTR